MSDKSDSVEALKQFINGQIDQVNTAIPCEVISYENGRVTVKPSGERKFPDGDSNPHPIIHNLRFVWPTFSGGQAGFKGPVVAGDKCLMICCQQAIDDPDDLRRYDLVDSYVIPGGGYSDEVPGNNDVRMFFGNAFIAIDETGKMTINAPGGIEETTTKHTVTGEIDVTGDVVVNGIKLGSHKHPGDSGGITGEPQN